MDTQIWWWILKGFYKGYTFGNIGESVSSEDHMDGSASLEWMLTYWNEYYFLLEDSSKDDFWFLKLVSIIICFPLTIKELRVLVRLTISPVSQEMLPVKWNC